MKKAAGAAAVALAGYDTLVRPRMLRWGASPDEQHIQLPGDHIASAMPPAYTKAVTVEAPPEVVWPWLVQIGDHRAGFYSYDYVERFIFPGTVHYAEGTHSAIRIHPELQDVPAPASRPNPPATAAPTKRRGDTGASGWPPSVPGGSLGYALPIRLPHHVLPLAQPRMAAFVVGLPGSSGQRSRAEKPHGPVPRHCGPKA